MQAPKQTLPAKQLMISLRGASTIWTWGRAFPMHHRTFRVDVNPRDATVGLLHYVKRETP